MTDISHLPERIYQSQCAELLGLNANTVSKRVSLGQFAPRYKGALGFYFLRDELKEEHLRKPHRARSCPACPDGKLMQHGGRESLNRKYFVCQQCGHKVALDKKDGGEVEVKTLSTFRFPPCLDCGGKVMCRGKGRNNEHYGNCRDCGLRMHEKDGVINRSTELNAARLAEFARLQAEREAEKEAKKQAKLKRERVKKEPKPKQVKPPKPAIEKAKPMAKTAGGMARENQEIAQRINARGLLPQREVKLTDDAKAALKLKRDREEAAELRRIDKQLYGY